LDQWGFDLIRNKMGNKTLEKLEKEIEYKKMDIHNSQVGFSLQEQEVFKNELKVLEDKLKKMLE